MIICPYCAHACHLKEGQVGRCGVNQNVQNTLKTLVYGHPEALHVDPVEKKPLYHFLPGSRTLSLGTAGCNFVCDFCQNWQLSQSVPKTFARTLSPEAIVALAQEQGCASISCTYNEPTIFFPYAKDIGLCAKEVGLKNIWVSNGFFSQETLRALPFFVDAANIDLKTFNSATYKRLGGKLDVVCDNLIGLKKCGIWVEVTTLLIPSQNDSEAEVRALARFIATQLGATTPWHVSAFFPTYKQTDLPPTSAQSLLRAKAIGHEEGLATIYLGNAGLANPTHCLTCKALLIERDGFKSRVLGLKEGKCFTCNRPLEGVFS